METLQLKKPIFINNKEVKALTYDTDEIDAEAYARADALSSKFAAATGKISMQEFNYGFQLYLGFEAILAVNKDIDIMDLKRIKGHDVQEIAKIGRDFLLKSEEASDQKTSEDQSEITPGSTKPASEN